MREKCHPPRKKVVYCIIFSFTDVKLCPDGNRVSFQRAKKRITTLPDFFIVPETIGADGIDYFAPVHAYVVAYNGKFMPKESDPFFVTGRCNEKQNTLIRTPLGINEVIIIIKTNCILITEDLRLYTKI